MRSIADDVNEEEVALAAAGVIRLPEAPLQLKRLSRMPMTKMTDGAGTRAILQEREDRLIPVAE